MLFLEVVIKRIQISETWSHFYRLTEMSSSAHAAASKQKCGHHCNIRYFLARAMMV